MTITAKSLGKLLAFQLTRSRGAWLHNILYAYILNYISTHTLTWSVTDDFASLLSSQGFQLTRSRGAWPCYRQTEGKAWNFNSHAHVERDQRVQRCWGQRRISTHTLTWSVTYIRWVQSRPTAFQLTRSRGAWRNTCIICHFYWYFNSHAHVERDIITTYQCTQDVHFNSHAHVERDVDKPRTRQAVYISTHTLTWSVTDSITQVDVRRLNFNSHAHVERDALGAGRLKHMVISTHTLTWSVTAENGEKPHARGFQLTRSRGAWHKRLNIFFFCKIFQLTRSRGAWRIYAI